MKEELIQLDNEQVAAQVKDGNSALYEVIVRRFNPVLYRIGRAYGFNHEDTEDLMQDTFVSAYFNLEQFQQRAQFKTWLCRIMANKCYHKKNTASYRNELLYSDKNEASSFSHQNVTNMETQLLSKELGRIIEQALLTLPENYRLVFTLREANGFSVKETANCLSITESNVKVRLNRAKKMMRTTIEQAYSTTELFDFNLIYCDNIVNRVMQAIHK